jgi:anti-sigma B factor antagonist
MSPQRDPRDREPRMAEGGPRLPGPWLDIREREFHDGTVWVTLDGELDIATADAVRSRLAEFRRACTPVALDLSELRFIDCSGLDALVEGLDAAGTGGRRLEISGELPAAMRRLIEVLREVGLAPPALG